MQSVITGVPVASSFSTVSRTASLQIDSNSSRDKLPRSCCSKAVMTFCGRGMLPIGSVGMVISKLREDSDARHAFPLLTSGIILSYLSAYPLDYVGGSVPSASLWQDLLDPTCFIGL